MMYTQLALAIREKVDAGEPLKTMWQWLQNGQPFCHFRFNDGESICAFGVRSPHERNNCGHLYMSDLGISLQRILTEVRDTMTESPTARIMVGGYWYTQGSHINCLDSAAKALIDHCGAKEEHVGWLDRIPWVGSDDLVRGLTTEYPLKMFDFIRNSDRPVYLIGNPRNEPGRYCLNAKYIPISRIDCWNDTPNIMRLCDRLASDRNPAIFVWCCGMSKPWIWDTFKNHPHTTHLDAGHLFDAVFGEYNRAYTRRRNRKEPVWAAYEDKFIPWCRSFIPG